MLPEGPGGDLSEPERRLVECARQGTLWKPNIQQDAVFNGLAWNDSDYTKNEPAHADAWPQACRLRPEVIRCLITGTPWGLGTHPWPLHSRGILIANAIIDGDLDLEHCTLQGQLWIYSSLIRGKIKLRDARAKTLGFDGTYLLPAPKNEEMEVNANRYRAICAQRLHADGSVFLRNGFHTNMCVFFENATITGSLNCTGGSFQSYGYEIGGENDEELKCKGEAINCDEAAIGGDLIMRKFCHDNGKIVPFSADGTVNLSHAKIGSSIHCEGGRFKRKGTGDALCLYSAVVGAGLHLTAIDSIEGDLRLEEAEVHTFYDDGTARPEILPTTEGLERKNDKGVASGDIILDGFEYQRLNIKNDEKAEEKNQHSDHMIALLECQPPDALDKHFRPQPWIQAAKALRDLGHLFQSRNIAYEREKKRSQRSDSRRLLRFRLKMFGFLVGYGYKPMRAIWLSLDIILFGYWVFRAAGNLGYMEPRSASIVVYMDEKNSHNILIHYTKFNALTYSFDAFLPGIELGQDLSWETSLLRQAQYSNKASEGTLSCISRILTGNASEWKPNDADTIRFCGSPVHARWLKAHVDLCGWMFRHGFHRFYYWLEEVLGWLFITLLIASASRLLCREE